jgi:putative transcriptional regulator
MGTKPETKGRQPTTSPQRPKRDPERRTRLGRLIEQGLREAIAYERGELKQGQGDPPLRVTRVPITARGAEVSPPPEYGAERVRAVRTQMGLSQSIFARALNVSEATVRAWEQGKRVPDGPSVRLLEFAEKSPRYFLRNVKAAGGATAVRRRSSRSDRTS